MPPVQRDCAPGLRAGLTRDRRVGPVAPRVAVERAVAVGRELVDQLGSPRRGEAAGDPDVVQHAVVVVEAEQQRPDPQAVLVRTGAGDHDVGGALVLHLQHRALALGVGAVERLGHDAVEPRALEALEPTRGESRLGGGRGELDPTVGLVARLGQSALEASAAFGERRRRAGRRRPRRAGRRPRTRPGSPPRASSTLDAAGWIRCESTSKSRPGRGAITISPSTTHGRAARRAATRAARGSTG